MFTGADFGFGDDTENDTSTDTDKEPEIVSLDALLDDSAQGVSGQTGDDAIIFSGSGDDEIVTAGGDDLIDAEDGNDTIDGGDGDDLLDGRDDDGAMDFLNSSVGDDVLIAGMGDYLNGGTGSDLFGLSGESNAYVGDFDPDEDTIEVTYNALTTVPTLRFEDTKDGVLLFC